MKILVFTTVFPNPAQPTHGLFVLNRILHAACKCEVRVVAPRKWFALRQLSAIPRREIREGIVVEHPTFFYIPMFFKFLDGFFLFLSTWVSIARLRKQFDFDLIDAHFAFPEGFAAILLGLWFRRPVIITLRGTMIPLSAYCLRRWAIRWTLQRADQLIAVSHNLLERAIELGAPKDLIQVIENGVDIQRFVPQSKIEARKKLGKSMPGKFLISVGHLSLRKGFHRVLKVLPGVLQKFPDLIFIIIGGPGAEGNCGPELRRLTEKLRLSDHVIFAGNKLPEEVPIWLNAADVFVLASDHEGCPNVVWEALSCGLPVVATKVGEVERMVPPYGGILFDNAEEGETLQRCLIEALNREWDHQRIRAYVQSHTWDQVADRLLEQWRSAAGNSKHAQTEIGKL